MDVINGETNDRFKNMSISQLTSALESSINNQDKDCADVLQNIMKSVRSNSEKGIAVARHVVQLLQKGQFPSRLVAELISHLMFEVDHMPLNRLMEMADFLISCISSAGVGGGKWLDLLPKVLNCMESSGDCRTRSTYLEELLSSNWNTNLAVDLIATLSDVTTSEDEVNKIIERGFKLVKNVEMGQVPPLIYQLLQFSVKGHRRAVLLGITEFFHEREYELQCNLSKSDGSLVEDGGAEDLHQCEGNVILHVLFAVKYDQEMGRELTKLMKMPQYARDFFPRPFFLSLCLTVSQIERFSEPILSTIKSTVVKSFEVSQKRNDSRWLRAVIPEPVNIHEAVLTVVKKCSFGWDHVTNGLVELGCALLDVPNITTRRGPRKADANVRDAHLPAQLTDAADLGLNIITAVFKDVRAAQKTILNQILNRVSCVSQEQWSAYYTKLLSRTVRCAPYAYLDCVERVKGTFEMFLWAPYAVASRLLDAFHPLIGLNSELRNSLLLIIRKAMFSRQSETRSFAAYGLLKTLLHFPPVSAISNTPPLFGSQGESLAEVHAATPSNTNAAVRSELVGMCKHALTQQLDVRVVIYEGLPKAIINNSTAHAVLELLQFHVSNWWDPNVVPPLAFEKCFAEHGGQIATVEPLPNLFRCINNCVKSCVDAANRQTGSASQDVASDEKQQQLLSVLEEVTKYFVDSDLDDFNMDLTWDGSVVTDLGKRITAESNLLFGIYDVLIEFLICNGKLSSDSVKTVLQLFSKREQLSQYMLDKSTAKGKNAKKKANPEVADCARQENIYSFSRENIGNILETLLMFSDTVDQKSLKTLRENNKFILYIMTVAVQNVTQLKSDVLFDDNINETCFNMCLAIGRALYRTYLTKGIVKLADDDQMTVDPKMCLQGFVKTLGVVKDLFPKSLEKFVIHASSEVKMTQNSKKASCEEFIKQMKTICTEICEAEKSKEIDLEAEQLVECVSLLHGLTLSESDCRDATQWLQLLCKQKSVGKGGAKLLVSLLCWVSGEQTLEMAIFSEICHDIHVTYGDIGEGTAQRGRKKLAIVSDATSSYLTKALIAHFNNILSDVEWALNALKAISIKKQDCRLKIICTQLKHMTICLHHLVQTTMPYGPNVGAVLRCLVHHYSTLTALTRHVLVYTSKGEQLNEAYHLLVRLTGMQLTQHVYNFFIYLQSQESENKETPKKKQTGGRAASAKILNEIKKVPDVVYGIEMYERSLIQLGKKLKVNLMSSMKLSTSRDFRINLSAIQDNEDAEANEEDKEVSQSPQPKKRKLLRSSR